MSIRSNGRHRTADVSSATLLIDAAKHHSAPSVKVATVAAASGGMVIAAAMPAVAAPAASTTSTTATVAAAGQLGQVSKVGLKKSRLKKVRGTVRKRTAVKRKRATLKRKRATRRTSRTYRRTYRRTSRTYRRVNRTYRRVSRSYVRRAVGRPVRKAKANPAPRAARGGILGTAASLSGIYYRWGGTTRAGFDCSGFVGYVFRAHGISLPRTAAQQQRATRRVSNPRPGDLVFFGSPAYHVGIYAGGGMMYDAPRTGRTTGLHAIWSSRVTYGRA
ncbi:C40 family peptidase [Arsenicicoccus dermatophilus]|uniref:C40 family peptidase n=1 Tax=Arsenicicoccus dermatophilus TaxID=1076331 RepID=UPI0039173F25